jgi:[ribosomal protein S5]-alanine N-acetyltransferase
MEKKQTGTIKPIAIPDLDFTNFPCLETQRLGLRALQQEDAPEIFELRSSKQVNQYLDRKPAQSMEEALGFIDKIQSGIRNNKAIFWAIHQKEEKKLVGTVLLWNISLADAKAELGYELLPAFQGRGFIQEAVRAVLRYGFEKLNLRIIEAFTWPVNKASLRVLEKFHFTRDFEAEKRADEIDGRGDNLIYSLPAFKFNPDE